MGLSCFTPPGFIHPTKECDEGFEKGDLRPSFVLGTLGSEDEQASDDPRPTEHRSRIEPK